MAIREGSEYIYIYIHDARCAYYDFYRSLRSRSLERAIKRIPNCTSNWTHAWYSNSVLLNAFPASWEPSHPIYPACSCVHPKFIVIFNRSAASTRFPFASFLAGPTSVSNRKFREPYVHSPLFDPPVYSEITKLSIVNGLGIFHEFSSLHAFTREVASYFPSNLFHRVSTEMRVPNIPFSTVLLRICSTIQV